MANELHDKLVEHLSAMEECCAVCEVESKGMEQPLNSEKQRHDEWVVRRELCRSMWAVLTWILRRDK